MEYLRALWKSILFCLCGKAFVLKKHNYCQPSCVWPLGKPVKTRTREELANNRIEYAKNSQCVTKVSAPIGKILLHLWPSKFADCDSEVGS